MNGMVGPGRKLVRFLFVTVGWPDLTPVSLMPSDTNGSASKYDKINISGNSRRHVGACFEPTWTCNDFICPTAPFMITRITRGLGMVLAPQLVRESQFFCLAPIALMAGIIAWLRNFFFCEVCEGMSLLLQLKHDFFPFAKSWDTNIAT